MFVVELSVDWLWTDLTDGLVVNLITKVDEHQFKIKSRPVDIMTLTLIVIFTHIVGEYFP